MRTTRALGIVVALLLAVAGPGTNHLASAQEDTDGVFLDLVRQTAFVAPDGQFELVLDTSEVPRDASIEVVVRDRVRSRSEFALSVTGERLRSRRFTLPARPLDELEGSGGDEVRLVVPVGAGEGRAVLGQEGTYPVEVRVLDAEGSRIGRLLTHLVLLPEPSEDPRPLAVALVAELALPPVLSSDGDLEPLPPETAELARVVEVLAAHPDVPLSLAVQPVTVEALAASDEADANAALVALREAVPGRQVLSLPYVDLDPQALLDADLESELDRQLERGERILSEELDVEPDRSVWLGGPTLGPEVVVEMGERERDAFVVDEGRVDPVDAGSGLSLTRTFALPAPGPSPAAVKADPVLAFRLADETRPRLSAHVVLAELAVLSLEEPAASRGVVIRSFEGRPPPVETVEVLVDALARPNALVSPVTLDQLFGQVESLAVEAELRPIAAEDLGAYAPLLRETRSLLRSFETMTGNLSDRTAPVEQLLSTAAAEGLSTDDRLAYVRTARRAVDAELRAVVVSQSRTITLTARTGSIPVTLRNDGDVPLNVVVRLDSDRLEFPDGESVEVTLADEVTRIDVAVRTRGSGSFPLIVEVTSPDGQLELASTRVTVRSTAVSGVGLVISVAAVAVLLLWWARNVRRGRRDPRLVGTDAHDAAGV